MARKKNGTVAGQVTCTDGTEGKIVLRKPSDPNTLSWECYVTVLTRVEIDPTLHERDDRTRAAKVGLRHVMDTVEHHKLGAEGIRVMHPIHQKFPPNLFPFNYVDPVEIAATVKRPTETTTQREKRERREERRAEREERRREKEEARLAKLHEKEEAKQEVTPGPVAIPEPVQRPKRRKRVTSTKGTKGTKGTTRRKKSS